MARIIHAIGRCLVNIYQRQEERIYLRKLGNRAENIKIEYPALLTHPEQIFIGNHTTIMSNSRIQIYPDKSRNVWPTVTIGEGCFLNYRTCLLAGADITIGDHVLFASDVSVVSHNHGMNPEIECPYMSQELNRKAITIGSDCWIADKVVIVAGTNIGRGSIIGAGSVVTRNIPEYSIAVGSPARVIKQYNFNTHQWERIL